MFLDKGMVAVGFVGQTFFFSRFLLQWMASEKQKRSVIPVGFWYLSILGGVLLFAYALWRKDPVFIAGQSVGLLVYFRNLYLIRRSHKALVDVS